VEFKQKLSRVLVSTPATRLIASTAREQWRLIFSSSLLSLVAAFTEGLTLGIIFLLVEVLTGNSSALSLPWLSLLPPSTMPVVLMFAAVLAQGLQSLMRYGSTVCISYFSARCRARITALIHRQVLSFSFACASQYKVGELTKFASSGPAAVQSQIAALSDLFVNFLMAIAYLVVLLGISAWLLLAAVVMGIAVTTLQKYLEPRIRAGAQRQVSVDQTISARVVEDYQALRLLHSTGSLELADQRLQGLMGEMEAATRAQSRRLALLEPVTSFLPILAVAVIVSLSLVLLGMNAGQLLAGLVTFVLALQRLNIRLGGIASCWNRLANNSGLIALTNKILESSDKQFRRIGGFPFTGIKQHIHFDNVSLQYFEGQPAALAGLDFTLFKGQTLALVGPSGAGKSSIADILTGLYSCTSGEILVDGTPLRSIDLQSWQSRLGVVSQDTFLFNASISDNLTFGLGQVSQSHLEMAAGQAQAAGFIESLPEGYNTLVGERGYRLSGGQRQRLSLARALLRSPDLLILDEATSALDSESERLVQEALRHFQGDSTVLVIAHRLSTIVDADQILVLNRGHIIQSGSHSELLTHGGMYKNLWLKQSQSAAV